MYQNPNFHVRDVSTFSAENLGIIKVNLRVLATLRGVAHNVISPMIFEQCLFAMLRRKWQRMLILPGFNGYYSILRTSSHALTILWFAASVRVISNLWPFAQDGNPPPLE